MRRYKATIEFVDKFSESSDPDEAAEIPLRKLEQFIERERLSDEGFSIEEVEVEKLND